MAQAYLTAANGMPINDFVCGSVNNGLAGTALPGWLGNAGIALLASTFLLIFLYALSVFFRNAQLNTFAKFELYELVMTLLIVVFVVLLVKGACNLTVGSLLPSSDTPLPFTDTSFGSLTVYEATQYYFTDMVGDSFTRWLALNYFFNIHLDQMASATFYSRPLGIGVVAAPLAGFSAPFKQMSYSITAGLSVAMFLNNALLRVFEFSLVAFLKWYLPLGLILRSFTPTRRIGGTLIAMALGFLFIFPVLILISATLFFDPTYGVMPGFTNAIGDYWQSSNIGGAIGESLRGFSLPGIVQFFAGGDIIGMLGDVASAGIGFLFTILFLIPLTITARAFGVGYLMPAVIILILVQAVRHMSKSLGEEIDITSLTRMI